MILKKANYFFHAIITHTANDKLMTAVFRKVTIRNLYIKWKFNLFMQLEKRNIKASHAKINFILIELKVLKDKLNYLRDDFIETNDYPQHLVNTMIKLEIEKSNNDQQVKTHKSLLKTHKCNFLYHFSGNKEIIRYLK